MTFMSFADKMLKNGYVKNMFIVSKTTFSCLEFDDNPEGSNDS